MGLTDGALRTFLDRLTRGHCAPAMRSRPWTYGVSEGALSGKTPLHLTGVDPVPAIAWSPLWAGSSSGYPYPTADQTIKFKSSSVNDDGAPVGTGAWTIRIWWLDSANNESTLDGILNGTTIVVSAVVTMRRINRVEVLTSAANSGNLGNITVYGTDGVTVLAYVPTFGLTPGSGVSDGCMRTVPAGKRDVLMRATLFYYNQSALNARAQLRYRTSPASPWVCAARMQAYTATCCSTDYPFDTPVIMNAGYDYGLWAYNTSGAGFPLEGILHGYTETV
jgi:hypothetical protein